MNARINFVEALEILDSRGSPTMRASVHLDNGVTGVASVPPGASIGENEAVELRDGDESRYGGKGVLAAVRNATEVIAPAIVGLDPARQAEIDALMIDLDGSADKSRLGANPILGVSMAVARAATATAGQPLFAHLGGSAARRLPMPMTSVINGGTDADNSLDFQEFMIVPHGAPSLAEAVRYGAQTFHGLKRILKSRGHVTAVGDEAVASGSAKPTGWSR